MKGRYFTIFLPILTGLLLLATVSSFARSTSAWGTNPTPTPTPDQCNQTFTYEKSSDYDDSRVHFEYEEDESWKSDYKRMISLTADSGYEIIDIWLEVDGVNVSGWDLHFTSALNNYNPKPVGEIENAKAVVKKVCASPSPTPPPSSQPSPSPSPSPEPCDNPEFWGEWYDHHGSCPSPSPTPSPSPSPSPTPEASPSPSPEASPSPEPSQPPVGGGPSGPSGGGNTPPQCPTENLPQKVDQVWFSDIQTGQVTVHWANKGDAHSYQIAYGPSPDNMPWGVEVGGDVSQVTLNDVPAGDLWVRVTANESDECGGQASDAFKVTAAAQPQVLAASGVATQTLSLFAGLGLISAGLWQAQSALKRQSKRA